MAANNAPTVRQIDQQLTGFVPCSTETDLVSTLFRPRMAGGRERLLFAGFDGRDRLVHFDATPSGGIDHCRMAPRHWRALIARSALHCVIVAHNHPFGVAQPSPRDIEFTRDLARWLRRADVDLVDHLIFTDAGHFSFAGAGLL